ncbi:MAG: hypothetical protein ACOYOK_11310, partial [Pseudobdellovibrionaceae bacterium]
AVAVGSLVITDNMTKNLQVKHIYIPSFFADENKFLLQVQVKNTSAVPLQDIHFRFRKSKKIFLF